MRASIIKTLLQGLLHPLLPHQRNHKLSRIIVLVSLSTQVRTIVRSIATFASRPVMTATSKLKYW